MNFCFNDLAYGIELNCKYIKLQNEFFTTTVILLGIIFFIIMLWVLNKVISKKRSYNKKRGRC